MSDDQIEEFSEWANENAAVEKPVVELPSGEISISDCAAKLFGLIAPTKTLFFRGGAAVALHRRDDGLLALDILRPAAARSFFEKHARLVVWRVGAKGEQVLKPTTWCQSLQGQTGYREEAGRICGPDRHPPTRA